MPRGKRSASRAKPGKQPAETRQAVTKDRGSFFALIRNPSGFPKRMMFTHKYVEVVNLVGTTGLAASYQFSCNGLFDPNITGTGHQPSYFDTMTSIYDHYTVLRSRIRCQILADTFFRASLYIDDDTSVTTDPTSSAEQANAVSFGLYGANTSYMAPLIRNMNWDAKAYFGGDVWDNDNLQGTASANPTEQSYYTIQVQSADGTTTVNAKLAVEIEYEAGWDETKTIAAS